jgi:prepilin-type processing-associated H-X9-DG protein
MRRPAFTLVEMLVAAGLLALLVALLLPSASRARERARGVQCLSNLRQIAAGFIAYATENEGCFPAPAGWEGVFPEDWVHWQPGRDPARGSVMKYLRGDTRLLVCPSGPSETWAWKAGNQFGSPPAPYPFSYSANNYITGDGAGRKSWGRSYSTPPCKMQVVVNPSRKILLVEEDTTIIDDGMWDTVSAHRITLREADVSVRHDRGREYGAMQPDYSAEGRGNVAFVDGHCDLVPRLPARTPPYTNPRLGG